MISKEIEELANERHAVEAEVAQKEADIRIKTGEMRSLQSELDTLTATLKQLETQRGAAQVKLDDLKTQVIIDFSFIWWRFLFENFSLIEMITKKHEVDNSVNLVREELKTTADQVGSTRDVRFFVPNLLSALEF